MCNKGHVPCHDVDHECELPSIFNVQTLSLTKLDLYCVPLYLFQDSQMSDDGGYGGGGDDYDYESGPGCVYPKKFQFFILLIILFSTSDLMMERLCVLLLLFLSNYVFLVAGRS